MFTPEKILKNLQPLHTKNKPSPVWTSKCKSLAVVQKNEGEWSFCPIKTSQQTKLEESIGSAVVSGFASRKEAVEAYLHWFPDAAADFQNSFQKSHKSGAKSYNRYALAQTPVVVYRPEGKWTFLVSSLGEEYSNYPHGVQIMFLSKFSTRKELAEEMYKAIKEHDSARTIEWFWQA